MTETWSSHNTSWYQGLMEQSLDDAKVYIEHMLKEIEDFEDSVSGRRESIGGNRALGGGAGRGLNTRASISNAGLAQPNLSGSTKPRRRQQILADTSVGNEVEATNVVVVPKSNEQELKIKCILKAHFLFRNLKDSDLQDVTDKMQPEEREAEEEIITQGEYGDKFYIMEDGECDIIVNDVKVGSYKGGQAFGDLALIYNTPRAATIKATADCTLWTLERAFFAKAKVTSNSNVNSGQVKFLAKLQLFAAPAPFFAGESQDRLTQLSTALTEQKFEAGQEIIAQGDIGDKFYILKEGTVMVTETLEDGSKRPLLIDGKPMLLGGYKEFRRKNPNDPDKEIIKRKEWTGVIFGERALIKKEPRAKNIVAVNTTSATMYYEDEFGRATGEKPVNQTRELPVSQQVTVLVLGKTDFESLLAHKINEMIEMNDFRVLQTIDIFKSLNPKHLRLVQSMMKQTLCGMGKRIETNSADLFVIFDGIFETSEGKQLKSGDVVGDLRRPATDFTFTFTCKTEEDSRPRFAQISRQAVLDNICAQNSDVDEELLPNEDEDTGQKELRDTAKRRTESVARRNENMARYLVRKLEELETTKLLGHGTFGNVFLGRHKTSGRLMAIKCLDKMAIIKGKQEFCVEREAQALHYFYHPFIADYYGAISSPHHVVFMLEFIPGGELWSYIYRGEASGEYGGLPLIEATRYLACVAMALEHIHSLGFCYRDLKPENLLISGNGYLKLVDFGLAKQVPFMSSHGEILYRTFTTCGTPEYMAPEIILTSGYDKSADFWALGVLFYEMLIGTTPFESGGNNKSTFEKICRPTIQPNYPSRFQPHCKVFLRDLLLPNAALRLGNLQNGFKDIYGHYVFDSQNINFDALLKQEIPMEYVPPPFGSNVMESQEQAELFDCVSESIITDEDLFFSTFDRFKKGACPGSCSGACAGGFGAVCFD